MHEEQHTDRRQSERRSIQATVDYMGTEGVVCYAVEDASLGGVRLRLSAPEEPGTAVLLRVRFEGAVLPSFETAGRVIWARQSDPYLVGIQFIDQNVLRSALLRSHLFN